MREIIELADRRQFTQGSIFDGFILEQDFVGYGIVITARCDIANLKARNVLCLPIYRLSDWFTVFGEEIIFRRTKKNLRQSIANFLVKNGMSESVIDTYPKNRIIEILKDYGCPFEMTRIIESYKDGKFNKEISFHKKEMESLVRNVISNNEMSIYFLEQVSSENAFEAFVVDLTNPVSVPFYMVDLLRKGLPDDLIEKSNLFEKVTGEYSPSFISVLKSPYIEHLLQKFSLYYSRIGTDDVDSEYKEIIQEQMINA